MTKLGRLDGFVRVVRGTDDEPAFRHDGLAVWDRLERPIVVPLAPLCRSILDCPRWDLHGHLACPRCGSIDMLNMSGCGWCLAHAAPTRHVLIANLESRMDRVIHDDPDE